MAQTLEYNKNVTAVVPVTIPTFDDDLKIIQALDDEPNDVGGMTAAELKAKFDEGNITAQQYINDVLIPAVIADDLTEQNRQAAEAERVANEIERVTNEQNRETAEAEREQTIAKVENLTATAVSLPQDSEATAEITADPETGAYNIKLGIPKGRNGEGAGDMVKAVYDPNGVSAPVAFRPSYTTITMTASKWSGNTYSFETEYPKTTYDISVEVAPTATAEQFEAFGGAMICGSADSNVATALGDVPAVDIPVIVKAVRK